MSTLRIPLRVVFYEEDGDWVAHCLEFDLVGVGGDKASAMERLCGAIATQVAASAKSKNPQNLFRPADSEFFQKFAAGVDIAEGELKIVSPKPSKKIAFEGTQARVWRPLPSRRPRRSKSLA